MRLDRLDVLWYLYEISKGSRLFEAMGDASSQEPRHGHAFVVLIGTKHS